MGSQILTHSPAEIMQKLLVSLSLGTLPTADDAWPITLAKEDQPDNCIVVYETAGIIQSRTGINGQKFERYGIQFLVRAVGITVSRTKISAISDRMDKLTRTSVTMPDNTIYRVHSYSKISPVLYIGKEKPQSAREQHTLNGTIAVTNLTTG